MHSKLLQSAEEMIVGREKSRHGIIFHGTFNILILLELLAVCWEISKRLWELSWAPDIRTLKPEF